MPIISAYCKKGGVGKTTFVGYLAHYYATQGKSVLVISADDQNSIFKMFGVDKFVTDKDDDFFEHLLSGSKEPEEISFEARRNMYLIKTLNTDLISTNLKDVRAKEKRLENILKYFDEIFDYVFVDFSPASCRFSEVLLDNSQSILIVVGLDALSLKGFSNTIQYFVDVDINLDKIKYVVPVGYIKGRIAPGRCLKELKEEAKIYTPKAIVTAPVSEKNEIKNIQAEGISIFDNIPMKDRFHQKNFNGVKEELLSIFKTIKLD